MPVWRFVIETISWLLLGVGLVCVGKTVATVTATKQLTPDSLLWLAAAFLVLLLGSMLCHVGAEQIH
jgi:hypothetical protein